MNIIRATKHILDVLWGPLHDPTLPILTNTSDSITLGHIAEARRSGFDIVVPTLVFFQLTWEADRDQNIYAIMQVMDGLNGVVRGAGSRGRGLTSYTLEVLHVPGHTKLSSRSMI